MNIIAKTVCQWIRRLSKNPQLRLLLLVTLTALALGAAGPGPALLQRVASWPGIPRGPVSAVDVSSHYGFVAIGEGGLLILDLADPARPVRVGSYLPAGQTKHVQVVGSRAYLGTRVHVGAGCQQEAWRSYLLILDVSDPAHPTLLGSYSSILEIACLFVDGNLAYLGETGPEVSAFRIVDVSNPARPVALRVESNGPGSAVWASGDRAYVTGWSALRVLDVSQPSSPVILTNFDQSIQSLQGVSNRLYTLGPGELAVYDLGTNGVPKLLGTLSLSNSPISVHVSGDRAYVASGQDGLAVIDVRNPSAPVRLGSCDTPGSATQVKTFGSHALVADSFGVQVVDLGDPAHPVLLSGYDTGLTTRGVRVSAGVAFILSADGDPVNGGEARSRLEILDVSNPAQPFLLGSYQQSGFVRAWDIAGDLACLAFSSSVDGPGLEIVDVSYPPVPLRLSRTSLAGNGDFSRLGISMAGQYAYVALAGCGVRIFDVSAPDQPVQVNEALISYDAYTVQVSGDCAYLGSDYGLEVFNVANPTAPVFAGAVSWSQSGSGAACLQLRDGCAWSGVGWNGFTINEVRNSTNLVQAGAYNTLGEVRDLCVADGRAFVAEGWEGLTTFDVSAPGRPLSISRLETCGQAYGIQVSGNYAFVAEGGGGLGILALAPGPVTVLQDPVSANAALGETTTLTVSAYGRGRLSYQWYAGESGDISHPIAGATEPSFTTPTLTQTAAYWVRVSSSLGTADSRAAWVNPVPPVTVELVGTWPGYRRGSAVDVQVAGNLAYVAAGGLQIWQVTNETSPRLVGSYDAKGSYVSSLTVSGNLAFLLCDARELLVIDVSRPANPTLLGSLAVTNGYVRKLAVVGSVAYAAGDLFRILDISDPTHPRQLGTANASGESLAVQGRYAYLVGSQSLVVLDVIDPVRPLSVANVALFSGSANEVHLLGNYAYVAERSRSDGSNSYPGGLAVVDVSKPSQPRLISRFRVSSNSDAIDVDVIGTHAFVADAGLRIIDVSVPATPWLVGTLTGSTPQALVVSEQRAYLVAGEGLQLVDITAPASPKLLLFIETSGSVQDVACFGHHALVADRSGGLAIVDVSNPRQPAFLGAYRTNGYGRRVVVNGAVACFLGDALHLLDLGDPVRPSCLGTFELGTGADSLVASGNYAYLLGSQLTTVDIRNPSAPIVVSVDPVDIIDTQFSPSGMALSPPYLFVAQRWEGMQTVDFSLPSEPRRLQAYYSQAPVGDVAVRNNVACITVGSEMPALEVVDIQDLWHPTRTASVASPVANNVAFMGSYACVTGEGLRVFDVADPQQPILVGSHNLGCSTGRLHIAGDLVYVAAGEYGLAIYRLAPQLRLSPPVIDSSGMHLSWLGGPGIRLQRAASLESPVWQDVPYSEGASSLRFSPTNRSAFFRLVRP